MEEEDDDDEIIIESKRSDDPACNLHVLADLGVSHDDSTDVDNNNVYRKRFTMESFLNASNENSDAGVVVEPEHISREKEVIIEDEVKCAYKGDVKTCNIDCDMDALFQSEDNIEANDVDICVSSEGLDEFINKSTDLYHSTDSIQYHSAEYDQPAVDIMENHDLFNLGVEISVNDNHTSGDFDEDVSYTSEIVNCEGNNSEATDHVACNEEVLDSAVTVTTTCEALLQENGDLSCNMSELSIDNSDSVVMNTFNISSDKYDATVTTMLEVSPPDEDTTTIEPCCTPDDKNSVTKTFEISSPTYDATITTRVTDVTSIDVDSTVDSNEIDISSHDLDGNIKTYIDDHNGKTEINFQVSSIASSPEDCIDTISDITPASISSYDTFAVSSNDSEIPITGDLGVISVETHNDIISNGSESSIQYENLSCDSNIDLINSYNENDSNEMMFLVSAESNSEGQNNSEQVDINIQDAYNMSSEHHVTQILSESGGTTYYEDVDNFTSEVSSCDIDICVESDGILGTSLATGIFDTLPAPCETDSSHGDVLYESNVSSANISNDSDHSIDVDVHVADISVHDSSFLSEECIDNIGSEVSPCDRDVCLERDGVTEASLATVVSDTLSFEPDSLHEDVLYESNVTSVNISSMDAVAGKSDHFIGIDVQEPDIIIHNTSNESDGDNMLNISGTYYDAGIEESSNITEIDILSPDMCTNADINISCDEIIFDNTDNNFHDECNISNTFQNEYAFPGVDFATAPPVVSSCNSEHGIDNLSTETDGVEFGNEFDTSYKMEVANNTNNPEPSSGDDITHMHVVHDNFSEHIDIRIEEDSDFAANSGVEVPSQVSPRSTTNNLIDSDNATVLNNSSDGDVGENINQVLSGVHDDIAFNPGNDDTVKADEPDSTIHDHTISPGDLQKISTYSFLEAGVIIDKTIDAIYNSNVNDSVEADVIVNQPHCSFSHENHVCANDDIETLPCLSGISMSNLNGFSEHEADVVLDKTFEELCNESFLKSATSTVEYKSRTLPYEASDIGTDTSTDKTFEDLSGEAANISHEPSMSSAEFDNSEKAYAILSIDTTVPDKVTTHTTPEDNFAHLSLSLDDRMNRNGTDDIGIFPGVSSETACKISNFSEHEADVIMNRTFKDLSNDVPQSTCMDSVLSAESETASEVTYHILSFEDGPSKDDELTTVVEMLDENGQPYIHNNSEHLPHGYNGTANRSNEILPKEIDLGTKDIDGKIVIIDKGLESREVTVTNEVHNELNMCEDDMFEDLSHETNVLNESFHQNKDATSCDDETYNIKVASIVDNTFDVIGDEPSSADVTIVEINVPEKTFDILSFGNHIDQEGDIGVIEKPGPNEMFEHLSDDNIIDVNMQMSANTDSFLDLSDCHEDDVVTKKEDADVPAYTDKPTENMLTGEASGEMTHVYHKTKSIEVDVENDTVINKDVQHNIINGNHRDSNNLYENIESNTLDLSNTGTVDLSIERNKAYIDINIHKITDNDYDNTDTHSENDQPRTLTVEQPSISYIDSSKVITIQHKTDELSEHITSNITTNGKRKDSPNRSPLNKNKHDINESDLFADPLDDYVIVDYNEVNFTCGSIIQPKFSFSTWSHKLKRVFSISGESRITKPVNTEGNMLRILEESRKISRDGEEIQVLTFHRTAVKSDGPASINFRDGQEGSHDGNLEGGTYNHAVVDASGNLIEREPGCETDAYNVDVKSKIKMMETNSKSEEISGAFIGKKDWFTL